VSGSITRGTSGTPVPIVTTTTTTTTSYDVIETRTVGGPVDD
jgi:hypothetical protein